MGCAGCWPRCDKYQVQLYLHQRGPCRRPGRPPCVLGRERPPTSAFIKPRPLKGKLAPSGGDTGRLMRSRPSANEGHMVWGGEPELPLLAVVCNQCQRDAGPPRTSARDPRVLGAGGRRARPSRRTFPSTAACQLPGSIRPARGRWARKRGSAAVTGTSKRKGGNRKEGVR